MKTLSYLNLGALAVALVIGSAEGQSFRSRGFGESDNRTILVVKPDGSCVLTNEAIQPRNSLEMQVTSWERYSKMSEGTRPEDEDAALTSPPSAKPAQKALTNEELAAKLREMYQQRPELG